MPNDTIAAIDLGSNSFHMLIARLTDGQLQVVDRVREMVQLAAGLDDQQRLSREAQARALDCLARFEQRLRPLPSGRVRAVGTNTLRQARNGAAFLARASEVLGHPVEIISGIEEARLIYLGVAQSTANGYGQRLVIDIGGGSTELIIGEHLEPLHLESLYLGCVSMTRRFFADGRISEKRLRDATIAVHRELEPVQLAYLEHGWNHAIGASGTIRAIREVVVGEGWSRDGITLEALRQLHTALIACGDQTALANRWNLQEARARVFAGGFAVLYGLCEALDIERLAVSDGALREGVIYDLVGRISDQDARDRTIASLTRRYSLDSPHAERVAATACTLFEQVKHDWQINDDRHAHDLEWAARLHEIGLALAHSQYHKHGAYIIEHSDLPGFSRSEQSLLAVLVRGHRRKFPLTVFKELPKASARSARRLCLLLRLAVLLHRSRSRQPLPLLTLTVSNKKNLLLRFPPGWLDSHPLTRADLQEEATLLTAAGFTLEFL